MIYVPALILSGYYFAIMKLYALCTHKTAWGTRAGIGETGDSTAADNEKTGTFTGYAGFHLRLVLPPVWGRLDRKHQ